MLCFSIICCHLQQDTSAVCLFTVSIHSDVYSPESKGNAEQCDNEIHIMLTQYQWRDAAPCFLRVKPGLGAEPQLQPSVLT